MVRLLCATSTKIRKQNTYAEGSDACEISSSNLARVRPAYCTLDVYYRAPLTFTHMYAIHACERTKRETNNANKHHAKYYMLRDL